MGAPRPATRESARSERHHSRGPGSLTEWTARPLGRLGRPLVAEIEAYLAFFSIARGEPGRWRDS
jgi:hypothetical protein